MDSNIVFLCTSDIVNEVATRMNPIYLKQIIEKAIKDQAYLKIDYVDSKMKITKDRIIEPREIKKDTVWAECYLRSDVRQFKFEGIQKIKVLTPDEL